jgi:hypothetical protein
MSRVSSYEHNERHPSESDQSMITVAAAVQELATVAKLIEQS